MAVPIPVMMACAQAASGLASARQASEERMHKATLSAQISAMQLQVASEAIEARKEIQLATIRMTQAIFERKSQLLSEWHARLMSMVEKQQTALIQERTRLEEERFTTQGPRTAFLITRIQAISSELVDLNQMMALLNGQFIQVLERI